MSMDLKKTLTDATTSLYAVVGATTRAAGDVQDAVRDAQSRAIDLLQPAALREHVRALPATAAQGLELVRAIPATATQQLCAATGELEKRYAQVAGTVRKVAAEPQERLFGAVLAARPEVHDVDVQVEPAPVAPAAKPAPRKPASVTTTAKQSAAKKTAAKRTTAKRTTAKRTTAKKTAPTTARAGKRATRNPSDKA